jgi:hypothetical protein
MTLEALANHADIENGQLASEPNGPRARGIMVRDYSIPPDVSFARVVLRVDATGSTLDTTRAAAAFATRNAPY